MLRTFVSREIARGTTGVAAVDPIETMIYQSSPLTRVMIAMNHGPIRGKIFRILPNSIMVYKHKYLDIYEKKKLRSSLFRRCVLDEMYL